MDVKVGFETALNVLATAGCIFAKKETRLVPRKTQTGVECSPYPVCILRATKRLHVSRKIEQLSIKNQEKGMDAFCCPSFAAVRGTYPICTS